MVGRTVSQYNIIEKLGAGGMGEIYKAQDTRLNRSVAIKVLSQENSGDPERRRRFVQEAQAASSLNHPNIVTIHDIVPQDGEEFMIMEFVGGKTLGELIPNTGMNWAEALRLAVQIADGLAAAHAAGIIHRDLKPGNIMVTPQNRVKILDFGLAKLSGPGGFTSLTDATATLGSAPLTVQGSILGTVSYMSPEQAQGKPVDARSDIFSFGLLLYEMLTGSKAFFGDSVISTLTAILRDEPRPIPEIVPGVPLELERVVHRSLRKAPGDRWQSMNEVHAELLALKQKSDSGSLIIQPPVLPPKAAPVAKSKAPVAVLGVVILAAAGGAWWFLGRQPATVSSPPVTVAPSVAEGNPAPGVPTPPLPSKPPEKGGTLPATKGVPEPPAVTPPAEVARAVQVTSGFPFEITLVEDIPVDAPQGHRLRFEVAKDLSFDNMIVVPKAAIVTGEVVEAGKKKFLGNTKPTFRLLEVAAVDGTPLKLRTTPARRSDGKGDQPIERPGRSRTKDILAPAGSTFIAYIDADATVMVKR